MWYFIRDYLTFDRRQRNGVFVLVCIIIFLLLYLVFSDYFFGEEKIDFSKFEKEVTEFEASIKQLHDSLKVEKNYFSGNTLVVTDSEQANRSEFAKKRFSSFEHKHYEKKSYSFQKSPITVELNTADTSLLKQLRGIGSVFAQRIIKFRDALGGFVKKEQLLEVYGFDKKKFELVSPYVEVDLSKVKRININFVSAETLKKHPYINRKVANSIYWYRINHGNYSDPSDILKKNLVDEQTFTKIAPYLKVNE